MIGILLGEITTFVSQHVKEEFFFAPPCMIEHDSQINKGHAARLRKTDEKINAANSRFGVLIFSPSYKFKKAHTSSE